MSRPGLRVLVVGAGVAGLALAAALGQRGVELTVVETDLERRRGYMLGLYPIATQVLTSLGGNARLAAAAADIHTYRLWDSLGRDILTADLTRTLAAYGPLLGVDRATLLSVLAESWSGTPDHDKNLVRIDERTDDVVVTFDDNDVQSFDLVVGADGLGSTVRQLMWTPGAVSSVDTGWGGWVGFVPTHTSRADFIEQWLPASFVGMYPVSGATGIVIAGPHKEARLGGLACAVERHLARTTEPQIHDVLGQLLGVDDVHWWPFRDVRTKSWVRRRVILIGDAAAGFLPTAGVGASMAMDSASRLADELVRTDRGHLPSMLAFYDGHQRPRVESVQRTSRRLARLMFVQSPALAAARNAVAVRLPETTLTDPILRPMRQWSA